MGNYIKYGAYLQVDEYQEGMEHGYEVFYATPSPYGDSVKRQVIPRKLLETAVFWMSKEGDDFLAKVPYVVHATGRSYIKPGDLIVTDKYGSEDWQTEKVANYKWIADRRWLQQEYHPVSEEK